MEGAVTRVKIKFHGITYANCQMNTRTTNTNTYMVVREGEKENLVNLEGLHFNGLNAFIMPIRSFPNPQSPIPDPLYHFPSPGCTLIFIHR